MKDLRIEKLAKLLVAYSNEIKPKERVLIIAYGLDGLPLVKEIYKECVKIGAYPKYEVRDEEFSRIFFQNANNDQLNYCSNISLKEAEETEAMFQIIAERNSTELINIPSEKIIQKRKATKKVSDILHKKKWVLFEYPTIIGAQNAKMSLEDWENFVFDSCILDWKKMNKKQDEIIDILKKVEKIRLVAEKTDLLVNVKNQSWKKCVGKNNMPDGEVFTSPIREKVDGEILFNTPTSYLNKDFIWIKLIFKNGKVVDCDSDNKEDLVKILDTDKGSRYLGEFAFGLNQNIQKPVKSILFDEKIGGSNHMALGKCYEEAPNGNDSNIHWDLILRHKYANGKVYFDDELVQEKGVWIRKDLQKFNADF